jgi:hypothetical protein
VASARKREGKHETRDKPAAIQAEIPERGPPLIGQNDP